MATSIYIRNMVCNRCISSVEGIFRQVGIAPLVVDLGEVKVADSAMVNFAELDKLLTNSGFERIGDKKSLTLEQIRSAVIEAIHRQDHFEMNINWSAFLSEKLGQEYTQLSGLFSSVTGITLEQYIIRQKVEKVKEYLFYNELSVKEIAFKMGYSSVAHLSSQFKKVTGLTPTQFKESRDKIGRQPLDQV